MLSKTLLAASLPNTTLEVATTTSPNNSRQISRITTPCSRVAVGVVFAIEHQPPQPADGGRSLSGFDFNEMRISALHRIRQCHTKDTILCICWLKRPVWIPIHWRSGLNDRLTVPRHANLTPPQPHDVFAKSWMAVHFQPDKEIAKRTSATTVWLGIVPLEFPLCVSDYHKSPDNNAMQTERRASRFL